MDFTKSPHTQVSAKTFQTAYKALPATVSDAPTADNTALSAPASHTGKLAHTGATFVPYAVAAAALVVVGEALMTFRRRLGAATRRK
ncbi:hypothetical protein [Catenulispora pinisilvae]|uniref:hypothetical protein n=1 Tax=Catenulispora pinisilvae TaxID=2705253 RepID=UPI00189232A2|nr:hypothetical protein [Catenulispora pinisilvae]